MIEHSFFMIVDANWRLDNARSPVVMLQEKTARTPYTLRVAGGTARDARSHAVRTYIPQIGRLFSSCDMLYVRIRKHSTAQHHRKKKMKVIPKIPERKKKSPSPLKQQFSASSEHLAPVKKEEKTNSRVPLSASYASRPLSPPPRYRFGPRKAFLTLCYSEPRRSPRVKPDAHRRRRSSARQCWCLDCVALSKSFSLVAEVSTA